MRDRIHVLPAPFQSNNYSEKDNDPSDLTCIRFSPFLGHFPCTFAYCLDDNFELRINHEFGQAIASVSVGEMCQNDTDCCVCCLLTQQQWIGGTFVDIHILEIKINRVFQCIHFEEIYF
jgi:hypothetical protein